MIKLIIFTHICANYTYKHVLQDVFAQTERAIHANVCTKKYRLFGIFSCIVLDFLLNLQLKTDTNKQIKAKFNINETNIKVKI